MFDELLIGAYPADKDDVGMLAWLGIKRVLNLVEDDEYRPGERQTRRGAPCARRHRSSRAINLTDYGGLPPTELETAVGSIAGWLDEGAVTYIHCRAGWQRSAAIAAGVVAIRRRRRDRRGAGIRSSARKPSADPAAITSVRTCAGGGRNGPPE